MLPIGRPSKPGLWKRNQGAQQAADKSIISSGIHEISPEQAFTEIDKEFVDRSRETGESSKKGSYF